MVKIDPLVLHYASKAFGVDEITLQESEQFCKHQIIAINDVGEFGFDIGFAEWAVPILESRFATLVLSLPIDKGATPDSMSINIYREGDSGAWCAEARWYKNGVGLYQGIEANGLSISQAVLLLAINLQMDKEAYKSKDVCSPNNELP